MKGIIRKLAWPVMAALALSPVLLFAGPASAAPTFPPGCGTPFTMNNANGNGWYVGSNDINSGTSVITVGSPGRTVCDDSTGSGNSVYVRYSNGNFMATNNSCTGVTIKSDFTSNGVVWNPEPQGDGTVKFKNQYCTNQLTITVYLASDNHFNTQWFPGGNCAGCFEKMTIH